MYFLFTDPPEISVETPVVFSGEGQEAMLVCIVHGEAQPEVNNNNNLNNQQSIEHFVWGSSATATQSS